MHSRHKDIGEASLLNLCEPEITKKLMSSLKNLNYNAFETIVKFQEIDDRMFIVQSGAVEYFDSNFRKIGSGEKGSCFGELSLVYSIPRTATVIAKTDVTLNVLEKEDFENLRSTYPTIDDTIKAIAEKRFYKFQGALFEIASIPENDEIPSDAVDLVRETYCIFQNPKTKKMDSYSFKHMLNKLSGKEFSDDEVKSVFTSMGGIWDLDGYLSLEKFALKIRRLYLFLNPTRMSQLKNEDNLAKIASREHLNKKTGLSKENTPFKLDFISLTIGVFVGFSMCYLFQSK